MKKILLISILILTLHSKSLPVEPSLVSGQLENGFKYTIKKNAKPVAKAEIRLIVNVGSLEEDEDQKGVAHLVEHMAFNGSKHFPKNTLISYLESIGVAFGSHLNASTGTTRTLYKLSVPLEKDNLEKSFLILEDWAGGLSFNADELEKERGVVLEEARSRDNVNFRLYQKAKDTIFANSKYKDRTPIGSLDVIKTVDIKRVKDFYDDWYRPEFMHLIIVGDFDVTTIKELIGKHFSQLKNSSQRQRASRTVQRVNKKRILSISDRELVNSTLSLNYFNKYEKVTTIEQQHSKIKQNVAIKLFNHTNSNQLSKNNPTLNSIKMRGSNIGDKLKMRTIYGIYQGKGKSDINALKELSTAIYSYKKFGFSQEEFSSVVDSMLNTNETVYKNLGNATSQSYADRIVSHALKQKIFIDEKFNYQFTKKALNKLSLVDVNRAYSKLIAESSQLILFSLQESNSFSDEEILGTIKQVKKSLQKPEKAKKLPNTALNEQLQSKKILSQTYNKKYDFWEFRLENGIEVIYKFNDYKKNSVFLHSFSEGGYSVLDDALLPSAKVTAPIISQSGTSHYSSKELKNIYAKKRVSLSPYISRYTEGFTGSSSSKDFASLLELMYLAHTDYTLDKNILKNIKRVSKEHIKQLKNNPKARFSKEFQDFYMNYNRRFLQTSIEDISAINASDIQSIYKERFSDAKNFTYIIVGDIEYKEVKKLTQKYLANLPTIERTETHKNRGIKPLSGGEKFIKFYENREISTLSLMYSKEASYSLEEAIKLGFLKELLKIKLREFIREDKFGVYGIQVQSRFTRVPYGRASLYIDFSCDPKRKLELVGYVNEIIQEFQTRPIEKKYIDAIIEKKIVTLKEQSKTSQYWQKKLKQYAYNGDKIREVGSNEKIYNSITPQIIQEMAQKYLDKKTLIYRELSPRKTLSPQSSLVSH